MEINRNAIDSLLGLDDDALMSRLRPIAAALGLNVEEKDTAARLRHILDGLSTKDLERAVSVIGKERAQEILRGFGETP